jgi:hypothetical protein
MPNDFMRLTAFFAVAMALLYAGWSFHQGEIAVTLYFMATAVALTVVTNLSVRKQLI